MLEWDSGILVRPIRWCDGTFVVLPYRLDRDECHGIKERSSFSSGYFYYDLYDYLIPDEPELNLHPE